MSLLGLVIRMKSVAESILSFLKNQGYSHIWKKSQMPSSWMMALSTQANGRIMVSTHKTM